MFPEQKPQPLKKPAAKATKRPNNRTGVAHTVFIVMAAVVAGFFGGWFGAQANSDDLSVSSGSTTVQREIINSESELINTIANDVGPSVVSVNVQSVSSQQDFFGFGGEFEQQSAGTGFIISADGFILTNRHVIEGASEVTITLSNGTEVENVEVVGATRSSDPLDIAFLKITDTSGLDLTPANLGDSAAVEVGDRVVAIGNALGQFQNTVTSGIISGFGRDIEAFGASGLEPLQNLFQTDAAINGGNSGGPLVNSASEVIAVNVATASADNISFAIPINDVKGLIDTVLEEGQLVQPFLGIRYAPITDDVAFNLDLPVSRGAYITQGDGFNPSIIPDSPADKAGLQPGDIITEIDGVLLDEDNSVVSVIGRKRVGDTIEIKVNRDGEELTLSATLEAAPEE